MANLSEGNKTFIVVISKGLKMPTLDFKGKQYIYSHHHSVPFRELLIDAEKSLPDNVPSQAKPSQAKPSQAKLR